MKLLLFLFLVNCVLGIIAVVDNYKRKQQSITQNTTFSNNDEQGPITNESKLKTIKINQILLKTCVICTIILVCIKTLFGLYITRTNELQFLILIKMGICINILLGSIYILLNMLNMYLNRKKYNNILLFIYKFMMSPLAVLVIVWASGNTSYVKINNHKISEFKYCKNLIEDYNNQKTESKIIKSEDIKASATRQKGRKGHYYSAYIEFTVEKNGKKYTYCFGNEDWNFVKSVRYLIAEEDEVLIEYYENSGIIKSIDNIDKFDYTEINTRTENLKKLKEQKY